MKSTEGENSKNPKVIPPEYVPVTDGSRDRSHNAHNIGGQTAAHINSGGDTISGRTSQRNQKDLDTEIAQQLQNIKPVAKK